MPYQYAAMQMITTLTWLCRSRKNMCRLFQRLFSAALLPNNAACLLTTNYAIMYSKDMLLGAATFVVFQL
jgi:hypothetical protein